MVLGRNRSHDVVDVCDDVDAGSLRDGVTGCDGCRRDGGVRAGRMDFPLARAC